MDGPYLYYRQGPEWVRVEADDYETENYHLPGNCPEFYYITWQLDRYFRGRLIGEGQVYTANGQLLGPGIQVYIDPVTPSTVLGTDTNGVTYELLPRFNVTLRNLRNVTLTRSNGQPDNCGDLSCRLTFLKEGQPVLTLDSCPPVTTGPDDCGDCCAELLSIARSIQI